MSLVRRGPVPAIAVLLAAEVLFGASGDPFAFFQPSVTLTRDEQRQLARGEPVARVLEGGDHQVAVFAAEPVRIDGDRLVAWMRRIEDLKKSAYVLAIGRFSSPPRVEDLAGLSLDDEDLSAVRGCRPGSCALKLSASEMSVLHDAAARAGDGWKPAVQAAFRELLLGRVKKYVATGEVDAYEDARTIVAPAEHFAGLLARSPFLTEHLPRFAEQVRAYPSIKDSNVESFVYWSKEHLARKTVVSLTHVSILRGGAPGLPDALAAGRQIYATHDLDASLGLTALMRGDPGGPNYLVYLNRSDADVLGGSFAGLIRWFVQRRLKSEAAEVLRSLRRRLETGDPPASPATAAAGRGSRPDAKDAAAAGYPWQSKKNGMLRASSPVASAGRPPGSTTAIRLFTKSTS